MNYIEILALDPNSGKILKAVDAESRLPYDCVSKMTQKYGVSSMGYVPNALQSGNLHGQEIVKINTVFTLEPPHILCEPSDFWYMSIITAQKYGCC